MKKAFWITIISMFLLASAPCYADDYFDVSIFQDNPSYEVVFDDMDDTGEIKMGLLGLFTATLDGDDGFLWGTVDIKIVEDLPPVIRLLMNYSAEDWAFTEKVIMKTQDTRYTFKVDRDTDVSDGKITEYYTIVLTDKSIAMLKDIVDNKVESVRIRLDGDRNVDGEIDFNLDPLSTLYADYVKSGALDGDFSAIYDYYPCEIK